VEASRASTREEIGKKLSQWELAYKARAETDPQVADSYYRAALGIAPDDAGILGNYASFLHTIQKDPDPVGRH